MSTSSTRARWSIKWWAQKAAAYPRNTRLRTLRWLFILICGPSFIAIILSIMRGVPLLDLLAFRSNGKIIAGHSRRKHTVHFDLPSNVSTSTLCHFWCESNSFYAENDNEKHLWSWLRPHCSCESGIDPWSSATNTIIKNHQKEFLRTSFYVLVGTGSLLDIWEGALLEAGTDASQISLMKCRDFASSSFRKEGRRDNRIEHKNKHNMARGTPQTVYIYESCLEEGHELLDLKPRPRDLSKSVTNVFAFFDHVLHIGREIRTLHGDDNVLLLWLVPDHFKSDVYEVRDEVTRSRGQELALLRQYIMQRHVLSLHGIYCVDTRRIKQQKELGLLGSYGSRDGHLTAFMGRLLWQNWHWGSSGAPSWPQHHQRQIVHLAEKCTVLMHSRAYDDFCMPRPHRLLPVLVSGLGGSATHAVAAALAAIGLDIPHESIGKHGSVCWMYAVNDVLVGTHYPHHARLEEHESHLLSPRFRNVLHVVRPPLAQISTFTIHHKESYAFIYQAVMVLLGTGENAVKTKEQGQLRLRTAYRKASSDGGCMRGNACNLYFAAASWLYWNRHLTSVQRHLGCDKEMDTNRSDDCKFKQGIRFAIGSQREPNNMQDVVLRVCSFLQDPGGVDGAGNRDVCTEQLRKNAGLQDKSISQVGQFHRLHYDFSLQEIENEEGALAKEVMRLSHLYGL